MAGAQGHAETDLAGPLANHIGQQAVDSDRRQKQRQSGKSDYEVGRKAAGGQRGIEHLIHGKNIEHRQPGIDALDFMPNLRLEQACRQRRAQHDADHPVRALITRNINVRDAIDVEPIVFDVPDNAYDGQPGQLGILSEAKTPAQRVTIKPVATSGSFIDNGDRLFAVFIAFGKEASADERRPASP